MLEATSQATLRDGVNLVSLHRTDVRSTFVVVVRTRSPPATTPSDLPQARKQKGTDMTASRAGSGEVTMELPSLGATQLTLFHELLTDALAEQRQLHLQH